MYFEDCSLFRMGDVEHLAESLESIENFLQHIKTAAHRCAVIKYSSRKVGKITADMRNFYFENFKAKRYIFRFFTDLECYQSFDIIILSIDT